MRIFNYNLIIFLVILIIGCNNPDPTTVTSDKAYCKIVMEKYVFSNTENINFGIKGAFTSTSVSYTLTINGTYVTPSCLAKSYTGQLFSNLDPINKQTNLNEFNNGCNQSDNIYDIYLYCDDGQNNHWEDGPYKITIGDPSINCNPPTQNWYFYHIKMAKVGDAGDGNPIEYYNFIKDNTYLTIFNNALTSNQINLQMDETYTGNYNSFDFSNCQSENYCFNALRQYIWGIHLFNPLMDLNKDGFIVSADNYINGKGLLNDATIRGFTVPSATNYPGLKKPAFIFYNRYSGIFLDFQRIRTALHEIGHKKSIPQDDTHAGDHSSECIMSDLAPTQQVTLYYCKKHKCALHNNSF
jgi:hypothetical protein